MKRFIKCKNEDGLEVLFDSTFNPFLLEDCDGIYSVANNVSVSENTMTDGGTYQGSVTSARNIVLTLRDESNSDHEANRTLIYKLFKPKSKGTFIYFEHKGAESRSIDYYVESIDIDSKLRARRYTISLICVDPFFVGAEDLKVTMAGWVSAFQFPFEIPQEGLAFGSRVEEKLKTIDNSSAAENIGLTITITAGGNIKNPSIYHVEKNEQITVGTENNPLNLVNGDSVIITTGTNDKHAYLVHNGEKTEINAYLSEDSEFIQLQHGFNTIGYSAEEGEEHMTVEISYRYRYLGA